MNLEELAQDAVEKFLDSSLAAHRSKPREVIPETGYCLYCDARIPSGRFCDSEHRDEFEAEQRQRRIAGKHISLGSVR